MKNAPTTAKGVSRSARVRHARRALTAPNPDTLRRSLHRLQRHLSLVRSIREFELTLETKGTHP